MKSRIKFSRILRYEDHHEVHVTLDGEQIATLKRFDFGGGEMSWWQCYTSSAGYGIVWDGRYGRDLNEVKGDIRISAASALAM